MGVLQSALTFAQSHLTTIRSTLSGLNLTLCDDAISRLSGIQVSIPANDRFNANVARSVASQLYAFLNSGSSGTIGVLQDRLEPPTGPFEPIRPVPFYNNVCDRLDIILQSARDQS